MAEWHRFGGDETLGVLNTTFPTGATYDQLAPGTDVFLVPTLSPATLSAVLRAAGGAIASLELVDLAAPTTALATISGTGSATGELITSSVITTLLAGHTYGVKLATSNGTKLASAWGVTLNITTAVSPSAAQTFTDLQNEVADRLNLTSAQALARIGRSINERYRWMASSCGLQTMVRATSVAPTVIGTAQLTFSLSSTGGGVEKIFSVFDATTSPPRMLNEVTFDQLRQTTSTGDPASNYAIALMGANTVTIQLNTVPASVYSLTADCESNMATLSGTMSPAFSEDYYNILTYFAMSVELDKMEKYDLASKQFTLSESRLSEYRLFIAKSAYLDIAQGVRSPGMLINTPLV